MESFMKLFLDSFSLSLILIMIIIKEGPPYSRNPFYIVTLKCKKTGSVYKLNMVKILVIIT